MRKLTKEQKRDIRAIAAKKDRDIDFSDVPPVLDWRGAEIGKFYRPVRSLSPCAWIPTSSNGSRRRAAAIRPKRNGFCAMPCFISPEKASLPIAGASGALAKPHDKKENHDPRGASPALSVDRAKQPAASRALACEPYAEFALVIAPKA